MSCIINGGQAMTTMIVCDTWVAVAGDADDEMDAGGLDGQLCDGKQPAVDITTGRIYDCDSCPPSTYCHRLSASSACCWIGNHSPAHPSTCNLITPCVDNVTNVMFLFLASPCVF